MSALFEKVENGEVLSQSSIHVLMHTVLLVILDLLHNSKTSEQKFWLCSTFVKRNLLMKNFWPLKARKAMLK